MALVKHLKEKLSNNRRNIHEEVGDSYFFIIETPKGKILQIDTYGRPQREYPRKVSQSIQFSLSAIKELKEILKGF